MQDREHQNTEERREGTVSIPSSSGVGSKILERGKAYLVSYKSQSLLHQGLEASAAYTAKTGREMIVSQSLLHQGLEARRYDDRITSVESDDVSIPSSSGVGSKLQTIGVCSLCKASGLNPFFIRGWKQE